MDIIEFNPSGQRRKIKKGCNLLSYRQHPVNHEITSDDNASKNHA